jgi:hypothetical protein
MQARRGRGVRCIELALTSCGDACHRRGPSRHGARHRTGVRFCQASCLHTREASTRSRSPSSYQASRPYDRNGQCQPSEPARGHRRFRRHTARLPRSAASPVVPSAFHRSQPSRPACRHDGGDATCPFSPHPAETPRVESPILTRKRRLESAPPGRMPCLSSSRACRNRRASERGGAYEQRR